MLLEVPRSQNPTVQKTHPIILFQRGPSIVEVQPQHLYFWYWLHDMVMQCEENR